MTNATTNTPEFRNAHGGPIRWRSPGRFGVLLSHADYVTDTQFDDTTHTQVPLLSAAAADEYGALIRRAQPGAEYEVMRLEDDVWRDLRGRTRSEVTAARWGDV